MEIFCKNIENPRRAKVLDPLVKRFIYKTVSLNPVNERDIYENGI
jgi:hypothetical protein